MDLGILPQLLVNGLISGSIYALAAAGLSLTYGALRVLNFAHGHLMMAGAYAYLAGIEQGPLAAGLCAFFAMLMVGTLQFWIFVQPFMGLSPLLPFVSSIAFGSILEAAVSIIFGVNVHSLILGGNIESIEFWGIYITPLQIGIIAVAAVVLGLLALFVMYSSWGRSVRALAENPYAVQALGGNSHRLCWSVFLLSSLLAGLAGILIGLETNVRPTMGTSYAMKAFAAIILGGLGSAWGAFWGGLALGLIENLAIGVEIGGYSLPAGYKDAFAFVAILLVLLVRPQGIFGKARRRV